MICPHYALGCGGCTDCEKSYQAQLHEKEMSVRALYPEAEKILGMEDPLHYRNKAIQTFAFDLSGTLTTGLYKKASHSVLPIRECMAQNERLNEIVLGIRNLCKERGLTAYNEDTGKGVLRHMVLRRGHKSAQVLVTLVTSSPFLPGGRDLARAIMEQFEDVRGVVQNINPRKTSAVLGFSEHPLWGASFIEDTLCGLRFRLSSRAFYQVNSVQAQKLYETALSFAECRKTDVLVDAYCGVGTIGLIAARSVGRVIGIESNAKSVEDAQVNAKLNHLRNVTFINADAGNALSKMSDAVDIVMLDPPRSGCDQKFLDALCAHAPKRIVYISCNILTQKRDTDILCAHGYSVRRVRPVDMFPFTEHIENIALLVKE